MKLIDDIKKKYPLAHFKYKVEDIKGFSSPFHSLYIADKCIISIADGYEPSKGKEMNEIYLIVETNLREHYPSDKLK